MDTMYRSVLARGVEHAGVSALIKPHNGCSHGCAPFRQWHKGGTQQE